MLRLRATEIIFLLGLGLFTIGIGMLCGLAWSFIASGTILLVVAFRNSAEREKGSS